MEIRNSTVLIIILAALNHRRGHFDQLSLGFVQILLGCRACRFFLRSLGSLEIGFDNLLLCIHDLYYLEIVFDNLLLCIHDLYYMEFVLMFNSLHRFFSSEVRNCSLYLCYFLLEL